MKRPTKEPKTKKIITKANKGQNKQKHNLRQKAEPELKSHQNRADRQMANICICLAMRFNDHKAETRGPPVAFSFVEAFVLYLKGYLVQKRFLRKRSKKYTLARSLAILKRFQTSPLDYTDREIKLLYLHKFRVELKSCRGYF